MREAATHTSQPNKRRYPNEPPQSQIKEPLEFKRMRKELDNEIQAAEKRLAVSKTLLDDQECFYNETKSAFSNLSVISFAEGSSSKL